jgi:hypothetical protein
MRSYAPWVQCVVQTAFALVFFFCVTGFASPYTALAAVLTLSPSSGSYPAGTTFTTSVTVQSGGVPLNAMSGTLSFPTDQLEVVSLSKGGSIITLWIQEPSFSNSAGTVQFEGVVPNPGYSGATGNIIGVTFRVKKAGSATVSFSAGSVLANDGEGTEVLTAKTSAQYSLSAVTPVRAETPAAELVSPRDTKMPQVTSLTHPSDTWSTSTTGTFTFDVTRDVAAVRLLLDTKPSTQPVVTHIPAIASREIADLGEGVSYLHVQYKTGTSWGEVAHYRILVDTTAPDTLTISEVSSRQFTFTATDNLSGIDHYEVRTDNGEPVRYSDEGSHVYTEDDTTAPGSHVLHVRVFDKAGNTREDMATFTILAPVVTPAAPATEPLQSSLFSHGTLAIAVLSVAVPLVALVFLLLWLLALAWRTVRGMRRAVIAELESTLGTVHQTFMTMRTAFEADAELLRKASVKRKLTREEAKILKHLQLHIDEAEAVITKEITEIER